RKYLTPAEEVLAHASNLQAWVENNYDTRLLHSNIAFPLLKELAKAGDDVAARALQVEIDSRLREGSWQIQELIVRELCDNLTEEQWLFLASHPDTRNRHLAAYYAVLTPPILAALTASAHRDNQSILDTIALRRQKDCMDRMPVITIDNPYATYACGNYNVLKGELTIELFPSEHDNELIPFDFDEHIEFRGNEALIHHIEIINRRNEYGNRWRYPDLEVRISSLARFVNLETLKLPWCGIKKLPDMTDCHALREIDVSCNHLQSVEQLAGAVNLERIDASRNYIRSLRGIKHLTQLVHMDFSRNEIASMKEIAMLTRLDGLHFRFNKIKKLECLHLLNDLEVIDLVVNEINDIDSTVLSDLERIARKLTMFTLANNPINENITLIKKIENVLARSNPELLIGIGYIDADGLD
ncbi:MAG: leucine-rich repeat domain-containing protein, partial [Candidatus Sigynarchaeota archaeon]